MGTSLALGPTDCVPTAMGRKPKKDQSTDINVGQHVDFSVAVQLASSHLVEDPRADNEVLNVVGTALARVVPVYFQDAGVATRRALSQAELEGSEVMHSATVLLLKDGRTLSTVSIKRRDLQRGIAVLRTVGIPELASGRAREPARQSTELLAKIAEIERLVRPPLLPSQVQRVSELAISIARSGTGSGIANLAVRLLSALYDARSAGESADHRAIELIVARMRDAIGDKD
jgi:hypothetical protein